jgi:hypothetical protein
MPFPFNSTNSLDPSVMGTVVTPGGMRTPTRIGDGSTSHSIAASSLSSCLEGGSPTIQEELASTSHSITASSLLSLEGGSALLLGHLPLVGGGNRSMPFFTNSHYQPVTNLTMGMLLLFTPPQMDESGICTGESCSQLDVNPKLLNVLRIQKTMDDFNASDDAKESIMKTGCLLFLCNIRKDTEATETVDCFKPLQSLLKVFGMAVPDVSWSHWLCVLIFLALTNGGKCLLFLLFCVDLSARK